MRFALLICIVFSTLLSAPAGAAGLGTVGSVSAHNAASLDGLLAATFDDIRAGKLDAALVSVNRLIAIRPDFKLAYLIKGDLLLSKGRALPTLGAVQASANSSLAGLQDEARVRLLHYVDQPRPDQLPAQILQLAPEQKYALLADASRARLYLFENVDGEPHLVHDYYLSVGKNGVRKHSEGDKRSPIGVYSFMGEIHPQQLTPFYGAGAFPLDYPNSWDVQEGNGGHGIWLHGVPPDTYSRPPKASDGCLVVSNPDWTELAHYIRPETTPIVITTRSEWLDRDAWLAKRRELLAVLDGWKQDWRNQNAVAFLGHYSPQLLSSLGRTWVEARRHNIMEKSWIRVNLTDISLFMYDNDRLAVINATQSYTSNTFSDVTRKQFYLRLESGRWRIAMEKIQQSGTPAARNVAQNN